MMTAETFSGDLMDGQSAAVRRVILVLDLGGLQLSDADSGARVDLWTFSGLKSDGLSEGVAHLTHRDRPGALLTSRDPALAAALDQRGLRSDALPRGARRRRWMLVYAAALVTAVAAIYLSVPGLSRLLARRVPLDIEAKLTLPLRDLLDDNMCREEATRKVLDTIARRLGATPGEPAQGGVRIDVLNFKMVNALTFPGGTVVVTRGLIEKATSADEVTAVLAHELEHVRQRHIMSHIIRSSILSLGWAVTMGDFSGLMVLDPQTLFAIANQSFSRDDERSADDGALARLRAGRISVRGFADFFQRLQEEHGDVPTWLSTHPAHTERLSRIRAHATREAGESLTPALTDSEWKTLRAACAGRPAKEGRLGKIFSGEDD